MEKVLFVFVYFTCKYVDLTLFMDLPNNRVGPNKRLGR